MSEYPDAGDAIRWLTAVHTCGGTIGCVRCVTDAREQGRAESKRQIDALTARNAALVAVLVAAKPIVDGDLASTFSLRAKVFAALSAEERARRRVSDVL